MKLEACQQCPIYNDGLYQLGIRKHIHSAPRYVENSGKKKVLIVAEAFGQNEDVVNAPLIGRSGKLLDQLLHETGIDKYDIKIDNTVKCRPIKLEGNKCKNRTPTEQEIKHCTEHYLDETLEFNPDFIILLGRVPFKAFFPDKEPSKYRGKILWYKYNDRKIMTVLTYHPAACLYQPTNKPALLKQLANISAYLADHKI